MPTLDELRSNIKKHDVILSQIEASISEIESHEAILFNQAMSGALDRVAEGSLHQKMTQLDAYRSDRYSLIEQAEDVKAERQAMCEEIVNNLRRKVGLGDLPDSMDRPLITLEADDHLTAKKGRHPGSRPAVVNHKRQ